MSISPLSRSQSPSVPLGLPSVLVNSTQSPLLPRVPFSPLRVSVRLCQVSLIHVGLPQITQRSPVLVTLLQSSNAVCLRPLITSVLLTLHCPVQSLPPVPLSLSWCSTIPQLHPRTAQSFSFSPSSLHLPQHSPPVILSPPLTQFGSFDSPLRLSST